MAGPRRQKNGKDRAAPVGSGPESPGLARSCLELLAQCQALSLIGGAERCAVYLSRNLQHSVIYNLEEGLSIVDQEGDVVRTDFQHHLGAPDFPMAVAEAWIEEAGIVRA